MSSTAPGPTKPVTRVELKRLAIADFIRADEQLRSCELLRGLSAPVLEALLASAVGRRFGDGGLVFQSGDQARSLFLVLSGEARLASVKDGNTVEVGIARKGECFGEEALVGAEPRERTLSATARGSLDVVELPSAALQEAIRAAPGLAAQLTALHAQRRTAQDEMADFLNRW